jgi:hypothetical protein
MLEQKLKLRVRIMLPVVASMGMTMLALRFNVVILLPAIMLGWIVALVNGVVTANSGHMIVFQMVLVAVALQLGYVAGIVLKWAILVSRRNHEASKAAMVPDGTF